MKLAIAGMSGFVGSSVRGAADRAGHNVAPIHGPRMRWDGEGSAVEAIQAWRADHRAVAENLLEQLRWVDVLVNAAGVPTPESTDRDALYGANALLPLLLAELAAEARVDRFIHVSSVAVQGRSEVLDETARHEPSSLYAAAKAAGERLLLDAAGAGKATRIVIYRPPAVQAAHRATTRQLLHHVGRRVVPVFGSGATPLPVTLAENVGAAVVFLAGAMDPPSIVLHPAEGVTLASLAALGNGRVVHLPRAAGTAAVKALHTLGRVSARANAVGNRVELFVRGQRQDARYLPAAGFEPPAGRNEWRDLAVRVRRGATDAVGTQP